MGAAMLALHGTVFAAALTLISWREHATTWRRRLQGRAGVRGAA
jgi:hypothetical protein